MVKSLFQHKSWAAVDHCKSCQFAFSTAFGPLKLISVALGTNCAGWNVQAAALFAARAYQSVFI